MADFVTNKGFESGAISPWTPSSGVFVSVTSVQVRTGSWSLQFNSGSGSGGIIMTATLSITDADEIAFLKGKTMDWDIWSYHTGGNWFVGESFIRLDDDVNTPTTTLVANTINTWIKTSVSHAIHASATQVDFLMRFEKRGGASNFDAHVDDMVVTGGGISGIISYPSNALARVSGLIHRFDLRTGVDQLEMKLGETNNDIAVPTHDRDFFESGEFITPGEALGLPAPPVQPPFAPIPAVQGPETLLPGRQVPRPGVFAGAGGGVQPLAPPVRINQPVLSGRVQPRAGLIGPSLAPRAGLTGPRGVPTLSQPPAFRDTDPNSQFDRASFFAAEEAQARLTRGQDITPGEALGRAPQGSVRAAPARGGLIQRTLSNVGQSGFAAALARQEAARLVRRTFNR